jgi:hypothetical protein
LQAFQQLAEKALGCFGIPAALNQDVQDIAVLVDGAPEIMLLALNAHEHFIHMPFVTWAWPTSTQLLRDVLPEAP